MAGKGEGKTKEAVYRRQLEELGVWQDAFTPEVKTLAQLERELSRAQKAWRATEPDPKKAPDMTDPLYGVITGLRREILVHRDALGLTPKALRKLRGPTPAGPSEQDLICEKLSQIAERVSAYDEGERIATPACALARNDAETDANTGRATTPPPQCEHWGTSPYTGEAKAGGTPRAAPPTGNDGGGPMKASAPTETADE